MTAVAKISRSHLSGSATLSWNYKHVAVAGFTKEHLEVFVEKNILVVKGNNLNEHSEQSYLHRGIAMRAFERKWNLAPQVEVKETSLKDGILRILLEEKVPKLLGLT